MSAERAREVVTEAKQWAAEGRCFLHAAHLVVAKAKAAYSGEPGDRFILKGNQFACGVVETEDGQSFVITPSTCRYFVPLTRETLELYKSMSDGVAALVMVGAKALATKKVDPGVGIKIIEAALTGQLRAMRAP